MYMVEARRKIIQINYFRAMYIYISHFNKNQFDFQKNFSIQKSIR